MLRVPAVTRTLQLSPRVLAAILLLLLLSATGLYNNGGVVVDGFSVSSGRSHSSIPRGHGRNLAPRTMGAGSPRIPTTTSLAALEFQLLADPVKSLFSGYGTALVEHPLPTKSATAGILCGVSDVIAQKRAGSNSNASADSYDPLRTIRFASKGCLGGILWMFWYDWIDGFLSMAGSGSGGGDAIDADVNASPAAARPSFYTVTGALLPAPLGAAFLRFASAHQGAVTTGVSMVFEQFLWCPLVYGTFEIPVSTLLNGGRPASIKGEIETKLNGLLVENFKVWTPANLLIYNIPLEWRLFVGNCIDVFWQSIVSDVSADCGGGGSGEECPLEDETEDDENELAFPRSVLASAATTTTIER